MSLQSTNLFRELYAFIHYLPTLFLNFQNPLIIVTSGTPLFSSCVFSGCILSMGCHERAPSSQHPAPSDPLGASLHARTPWAFTPLAPSTVHAWLVTRRLVPWIISRPSESKTLAHQS
jgi:hypothetical protein